MIEIRGCGFEVRDAVEIGVDNGGQYAVPVIAQVFFRNGADMSGGPPAYTAKPRAGNRTRLKPCDRTRNAASP